MKKVSVIIPTVKGVSKLPAIEAEYIIIDNGPEAKSTVAAKVLTYPTPLGFARACNEGAKQAAGEILFFLNDDIEIENINLIPLLGHFDAPDVFAVTPKVLRLSEGKRNEAVILGSFAGGVITTECSRLDPDRPVDIFQVCGAAFLVDKSKFFELGTFDELFTPFYYEETDLSYRAQKKGWRIIYDPRITVLHRHSQTIGGNYSKFARKRIYFRNQLLSTWKNISDPLLLAWHIFSSLLIIFNPIKWFSLFDAIIRLPAMLKRRSLEKKMWRLSDRAVFRQAVQQKMKIEVKNILIIRPDAIGDIVLTLPAIQAVRKYFPAAKITVLAREYTSPIIKTHPAVDAVIFDYDLQKYHFDLSINFFNEFKDTFATFKARIPYRIGDSSRILTGWMNNFRVFRDWTAQNKHEVEQNYELLRPLGIPLKLEKPIINISPYSLEKAMHFLKQNGVKENENIIGIHIGSATSHAWRVENFVKIGSWLSRHANFKIILLGGAKEIERSTRFSALAGFPFVNCANQLDLPDLIALISRLSFYLGMDTGPTHIAAALNVPQVMLCLNKNAKPTRWGPWLVRHLTVAPKESEDTVPVERALEAVKTVLAGGGVSTIEEARKHWLSQSG